MGKVRVINLGYDLEEINNEVDNNTKESIKEKFSIEDEIKILRKAVFNLGCKDKDFLSYHDFINEKVNQGKIKKQNTKGTIGKIKIKNRSNKKASKSNKL